jgi:hypothetical protein
MHFGRGIHVPLTPASPTNNRVQLGGPRVRNSRSTDRSAWPPGLAVGEGQTGVHIAGWPDAGDFKINSRRMCQVPDGGLTRAGKFI